MNGISEIKRPIEDIFELEMIKNANDTIVKLLEIKKMYNTQEISFEEYSISTTAIVANLKFGVKDQRTECIFKNVLVCLPDNMRSKFKSGEKEAEK